MKIRAFNEIGLSRVRRDLANLYMENRVGAKYSSVSENDLDVLLELTKNESCLLDESHLEPEIDGTRTFDSGYEFGKYLSEEVFNSYKGSKLEKDGLWTWIAMVFIKQLLEKQEDGLYRLWGGIDRLVCDVSGSRRYYRHLVYFRWYAYKNLGSASGLLLNTKLHTVGEIAGILTHQRYLSNLKIFEMVSKYFYLHSKNKAAKSFLGKGDGSIRKLVKITLPRLEQNFDLRELEVDEIFDLLPNEYKANAF